MLKTLGTDYIDVLTFYYVEETDGMGWRSVVPAARSRIAGPPGATVRSAFSA